MVAIVWPDPVEAYLTLSKSPYDSTDSLLAALGKRNAPVWARSPMGVTVTVGLSCALSQIQNGMLWCARLPGPNVQTPRPFVCPVSGWTFYTCADGDGVWGSPCGRYCYRPLKRMLYRDREVFTSTCRLVDAVAIVGVENSFDLARVMGQRADTMAKHAHMPPIDGAATPLHEAVAKVRGAGGDVRFLGFEDPVKALAALKAREETARTYDALSSNDQHALRNTPLGDFDVVRAQLEILIRNNPGAFEQPAPTKEVL